jgi:SAM-dependent methyltransferase
MEHRPSWYDRHVLPYLLDFACGMPQVAAQRRKVIPHAAGRVLEIGVGTGLNLAFYDKAKVTELVAVDPAQQMHRLVRRRSERAGLPVQLLALSAERLPLESASFDCVVCTYTLCSVQDPVGALAEMRRVLRPGGTLLFAEHGLAPDASVLRWQHRIEPWWSPLAGGCHLTRDVPLLLREAGFHAEVDAAYIAGPKALSFNYWGRAVPDADRFG